MNRRSPARPPVDSRPAHGGRGRRAALAWLVLACATGARADVLRVEEGVARVPGGGATLYREQHWIRSAAGRPLERLVLYRCADGTAFARKRVDYRGSALAPAFALDDRRTGYREGLRRDADGPRVFVREGAHAPESTRRLDAAALVADAGFDEFIRLHWAGLVAGQRLPLAFAVPARLRSLPFSLQKLGSATVAGEAAWVFRLRLDGLLGLVAPAIEVSYGQASRRLLRFEGLSNLRDDGGDRQLQARIDFAAPARTGSEAEWKQATAWPLSACRIGQ